MEDLPLILNLSPIYYPTGRGGGGGGGGGGGIQRSNSMFLCSICVIENTLLKTA